MLYKINKIGHFLGWIIVIISGFLWDAKVEAATPFIWVGGILIAISGIAWFILSNGGEYNNRGNG